MYLLTLAVGQHIIHPTYSIRLCPILTKYKRGDSMNVIFDCDNTFGITDCDVDDGLALLYLLGKPQVNLLGITSTYGNSDIETTYGNTKKMLQELHLEQIPLLKGNPHPNVFESEAVDFLVDMVNQYAHNISILATGSMSNLYGAYAKDPDFYTKISEVVLMGGITNDLIINGRNLDELNFSIDGKASYNVLSNASNLSVITGNNCLMAYFDRSEYEQRLKSCGQSIGAYIYSNSAYWFDYIGREFQINGFYNWDVVAAAYLVEKELFIDHLYDYNLSLKDLEKGKLLKAIHSSDSWVNMPYIKNMDAFTHDVYSTWLNNKIEIQ